MKNLFYFFLIFSLIASCGTADSQQADDSSSDQAPPPPAPSEKYTLTPFSPSTEFMDAKLNAMAFKDGTWTFDVEGDKYKLGEQTPDAPQKMCANSAKGQHLHVIIDDKPYAARYTASFSDLDISEGEHYVLAFLSRSYHESIKTAAAHKAMKVKVDGKSITSSKPITSPMLFYSRPKGTYIGKANTDKVMLDFYLTNITLGANYQVKADINGQTFMIDKWQPYYIEGLPMGKNTITLTLVHMDGTPVDAPLNPVTREFELKADELENS